MISDMLKTVLFDHMRECFRCAGQSPCPTQIHLFYQWRMAYLTDHYHQRTAQAYAHHTR